MQRSHNNSIFKSMLSSTDKSHRESATFSEVVGQAKVLVLFVCLVVLTFLTLVGNTLVCRTVYSTRRFHKPGFYFVVSLSVADFLVGLLVMPVSTAYYVTFAMTGKWIFGIALCDAWSLANLWFCIASIFSLCAVTWDRYVAIKSPLHYSLRMRTKQVTRLIVAIWLTSFIAALLNCYGLKTSPTRILCEVQGIPLQYTILDFILVYLFPLTTIVFVNIFIAKAVSGQLKRVQQQYIPRSINDVVEMGQISNTDFASNPPNVRAPGFNLGKERNIKHEIKTFRTFLIVTGSFFVSWSPFFFILLVDPISKVDGNIMYICVILTYINSASNPLVYGIFNETSGRQCLQVLKIADVQLFNDLGFLCQV
ncbi:LOW QUALITY PROTEIN: tyramine receptor 1 [Exaiptasia diaphana]|uniref:G-protein coupled receptors family 1 profile domain-containing protein n=1 Tax=Exaiptasia diaphana TaxID=2652724 RepID=A0A913YVN2_EXADI|nr:LOW QUALITY PROTEIN: tyramine receptor 1 [Exaiptasia diaphana]